MKKLSNMTLRELLALDAAVTQATNLARQREANALIEKVSAQAKALGLSTKQLFRVGSKPVGTVTRLGRTATGRKSPGKVAAKYKNKKTGETWSGRGRMARWLTAEVKKGRTLKSFAV